LKNGSKEVPRSLIMLIKGTLDVGSVIKHILIVYYSAYERQKVGLVSNVIHDLRLKLHEPLKCLEFFEMSMPGNATPQKWKHREKCHIYLSIYIYLCTYVFFFDK